MTLIANSRKALRYAPPPVQVRTTRLSVEERASARFAPYAREPYRYCQEVLHFEPWRGSHDRPGQAEILDAYTYALGEQLEGRSGGPTRIRVESGHGIGKTRIAAAIACHFLDCFPSLGYAFAPTYAQINDLLFKEIRLLREDNDLPGKVFKTPEWSLTNTRFFKGRATSNAGGAGSERAQGQHAPYMLFLVDEAEGVADFVYDAIDAMALGGVRIVVFLANPRTRTSRFHKAAARPDTMNLRVSCLYHPNVITGQALIPGAVERGYIDAQIDEGHAEPVEEHDPDEYTFELPWKPGVILRPGPVFLWRVLGVAPKTASADTFCPPGRYEAAANREPVEQGATVARIGIDVARWGNDEGRIYTYHDGSLRRIARIAQLDSYAYVRVIEEEAQRLADRGVISLHIRVDGGGGFGSGVVDILRRKVELRNLFEHFQVLEVLFNAPAKDQERYTDLATEMYAAAAEALKVIAVVNGTDALMQDLCERKYTWVTRKDKELKQLEPKDAFRRRYGRSPDDGDGAVLALASDRLVAVPAKGILAQGSASGWGAGGRDR